MFTKIAALVIVIIAGVYYMSLGKERSELNLAVEINLNLSCFLWSIRSLG